ncbi:MAG: Vi polysaccharide biosynthesis protein VipB/TviC [Deltaproteobacteria bacterium RIFCSPLOWO2_01_44_7]|nr:MAG: Vi polysaccharide biosynthesis protein VipB/TviC [Deltaproteobacteria bacterium RIFCSPHIGHO2_01_FULL_43_49]OGQ15030.1 MAG: Vi polysaccharide biosynthesis protein VipB/TviC [Deltaproteobacteria bacterium RIFCSPHIGHO2_02_FULL_44_53]OGQ27351.1 MAG: Vi polysaccharide biosynthesis protein VipB/TviC [Deltaproteobacteria bacterium RIFCSPHIGHO2_12_FULL_44_21]OGQ31547.1 MAG: Vi polysaccharide biosynthesis protein VipB/TviC [Deltaproteobacteria bacterium RIFCSPLOWO2_01_FULL_45_74]OGQ39016.1 MAG: 
MKKVLVTGGAGFIGSHLVDALVQKGYQVRVLDNFSTGSQKNLQFILSQIELIEGDIRDFSVCEHALKDIEIVFHLAALGSVQRSMDNPIETHQVNSQGTLNLLQASKEASVKFFVYSSSSSVYGDSEVLPKKESMEVKPKSPYAVSKLTGEYFAQVFWEVYSLPTISLRYFNVFGPRQNSDSLYAAVIPKFIRSLALGKQPTIFGDGSQSRAFTYVSNVVEANLLVLKMNKNSFGEVFNIASIERIMIQDLWRSLLSLSGENIEPLYVDFKKGDIRHSQADTSKACQVFGYNTSVLFQEGLKRTFEWFRKGS